MLNSSYNITIDRTTLIGSVIAYGATGELKVAFIVLALGVYMSGRAPAVVKHDEPPAPGSDV